jgi:hypothetical protein
MSVNSATDTFTDSAELFDQEKYWSTVSISIEPDPIQMEEEFKKPLSERIFVIQSPPNSMRGKCRLDDVIVDSVTDAYRIHQKNQWNILKTEAGSKKWVWIATAIGFTIAASIVEAVTGAHIATSPLTPMLFVGVTIVAIVSLFLIVKENSKINQAHTQISKWDANPVLKIGKERDEAHKQGFPYIYTHNLKLGQEPSYIGRFHPKQVEHEYKKYFKAFCETLLDQSCNACKSSWMGKFRSFNPISYDLMSYGLGHIPEHMKPVIEDYTRLESFLSDLSDSYERLKSSVRDTAKERVNGYTKSKNEELESCVQARDSAIATAKTERDKIFERHPLPTDRRHKEAEDNYNAIKKALEDNYTRKAALINKKYDGKIQEAEKERHEQIKTLNGQKSHQLANNYKAAHELLIRAKQAWDNKDYQPVNLQPYFPYQSLYSDWYQPQPGYYQQPSPQPTHYPNINQGYGMPTYGYPVQQQAYVIQA